MSIKLKNSEDKFSFAIENGLIVTAPKNADIFVHFAQLPNGTEEVHGRVRLGKTTGEGEAARTDYQELGWVRTGVTIKSNDADRYAKGHAAVLAEVQKVNPSLVFEIV